jgi:hypothetical protein
MVLGRTLTIQGEASPAWGKHYSVDVADGPGGRLAKDFGAGSASLTALVSQIPDEGLRGMSEAAKGVQLPDDRMRRTLMRLGMTAQGCERRGLSSEGSTDVRR